MRDAPKDIHRAIKAQQENRFLYIAADCGDSIFCHKHKPVSDSTRNLQISENICSTLAVTELYGEVDQYGKWKRRLLTYRNRTENKISKEMS